MTWSTMAKYNTLAGSLVRVPDIKARPEDDNNDGTPDRIVLELGIPLAAGEDVVGAQLLAEVRCLLDRCCSRTRRC
jgi:transmembrane protein 231